MKSKEEHPSEKEHFLRSLEIFKHLDDASLFDITQSCFSKKIPKGSFLFFQSDPAEEFYIVRSGAISILLDSADGRELVINELHAGDLLGELALLTGRPRSTGARARVDSEVLVVPGRVFMAVLDSDPQLTRRILEITAQRLSASSEREGALAFMDAEARLARVLLQLDRRETEKGYVTISQAELAQRASLTRQTVAKALGRWRRAGWLLTGRGRIMLLNYAALEKLERQD